MYHTLPFRTCIHSLSQRFKYHSLYQNFVFDVLPTLLSYFLLQTPIMGSYLCFFFFVSFSKCSLGEFTEMPRGKLGDALDGTNV